MQDNYPSLNEVIKSFKKEEKLEKFKKTIAKRKKIQKQTPKGIK
ncbi:hypothetical protein [Campylobacter fetus]|nr:hypothetical protein [Campylobacter fetus]